MFRLIQTAVLLLGIFFSLPQAFSAILSLKVFPQNSSLGLAGETLTPGKTAGISGEIREYVLNPGTYSFVLSAPGYRPRVLRVLLPPEGCLIEEKLEPWGTNLRLLGEASSGSQPKSVEFFGNDGLVVTALLNGPGVEIFDSGTGLLVKKINMPEPYASLGGFVESTWLSGRREIWVSQMESRMVHVIDSETLEYKRSLPSGGRWTKVLAHTPDEKYVYASNWYTKNIGVINTRTGALERVLPVSGIPRGMVFTPDGKYLYVCVYETGHIEKIRTETGQTEKIIETGPGAARHIVMDPKRRLLYVSDMWHGTVYSLSLDTEKVVNRLRIGPNLNTIKLSNDGRYLYISSRGKNNPQTYLVKGPDFGSVTVLDTESFRIVDRIWGRNQPTGLALSPDNRILVFTDFLQENLEMYDISGYLPGD